MFWLKQANRPLRYVVVNTIPATESAMGKPIRRAAPAGGKGATKGRKGKAPDPGQRLPKFILAPYVDEAGCLFYCRGQEEDAVLKPASIAAGAASSNSEWASRLGIALSESSGVAEMGHAVLEELFPEEVDLEKAFKAMGIHKLQELMATPDAKKFLEACALLNKKNQAEIAEDNLKEAVKDWNGWWTEESATKAKTFRKLARIAARLCLWNVEQLAFATEPKAYAKAMKAVTTDDTPEAIKAWQKDPQSEGKLLKALRAGYRAQIQPQKKKARKGLAVDSGGAGSGSAKAAASSDTSSPPAGSGSGDGSSSSEAAKKKKKAEAKKAKAKAEKEKKDAKDKKKAKEKNEAKEKTKAKKEKKVKAKSKDTGKKEEKQKTDESNTEEASRESAANKRKRPAALACASMQDESSDAAAAEEKTQQLLLPTWQLSGIQSSSGEWEEFIEALQGKTATAEDFTKHLEMIPASVRAAFNLKVTKIPTKKKNLEHLIERLNLIHSKGVAFWEAQQGTRAGTAAPEVKEIK
eukprot:s5533_g1.t1